MLKINKERVLVFDTETTGLPSGLNTKSTSGHEILQLAMIDGTGVLKLNEQFKPIRKREWPEAQKIHGIAPKDVQEKPSIETYTVEIQKHIDYAELLVAYNFHFDYVFLREAGISFSGKRYYDVMHEFSKKHGGKRRYGTKQYVSLKKCAAYYGYDLSGAHDAEEDARATLHCFIKLQEEKM